MILAINESLLQEHLKSNKKGTSTIKMMENGLNLYYFRLYIIHIYYYNSDQLLKEELARAEAKGCVLLWIYLLILFLFFYQS